MTDAEFRNFIMKNCFWIDLNMNDAMYYACADTERVSIDDLEKIIPLYDKYGWHALLAYVSVKRGHDPEIQKRFTQEFYAAKEEILKMKETEELYFE